MSDIKLLNGLVSDVIDSPCLLFRIGFPVLGTTRSRDLIPSLAPVTRNYSDDNPPSRNIYVFNSQTR